MHWDNFLKRGAGCFSASCTLFNLSSSLFHRQNFIGFTYGHNYLLPFVEAFINLSDAFIFRQGNDFAL